MITSQLITTRGKASLQTNKITPRCCRYLLTLIPPIFYTGASATDYFFTDYHPW